MQSTKRSVFPLKKSIALIMALSVLAASVGGTIRGADAVEKSYPDFFEVLQALGIRAEIRP